MSKGITYLFNPIGQKPLEALKDIAYDYKRNLDGEYAPKNLIPDRPLEKTLEVMHFFGAFDVNTKGVVEKRFDYNGVTVSHHNEKMFLTPNTNADENTARVAEPRPKEPEVMYPMLVVEE